MAIDKKASRLRRSRQTRLKIRELRVGRLSVFRSNSHIYANIISPEGDKVLVSASTLESEVRAAFTVFNGCGEPCAERAGDAAVGFEGIGVDVDFPADAAAMAAGAGDAAKAGVIIWCDRFHGTLPEIQDSALAL